METKDKVKDNLKLENAEDLEPKVKKKSLIKFIHVFESDIEKKPAKRKGMKKKIKHNLNRKYNPMEEIWRIAEGYYYLNPSKLYF